MYGGCLLCPIYPLLDKLYNRLMVIFNRPVSLVEKGRRSCRVGVNLEPFLLSGAYIFQAICSNRPILGKVTFSLLLFLDIQPIIHKSEFLCRHIFFYCIISLRSKHSVPSSNLFRLLRNHVHPGIRRASQMNEYFALRFVFLTQYKVLNEMHLECKRQTKILVSGKKVQRRTTTENFGNSFMIMLMHGNGLSRL